MLWNIRIFVLFHLSCDIFWMKKARIVCIFLNWKFASLGFVWNLLVVVVFFLMSRMSLVINTFTPVQPSNPRRALQLSHPVKPPLFCFFFYNKVMRWFFFFSVPFVWPKWWSIFSLFHTRQEECGHWGTQMTCLARREAGSSQRTTELTDCGISWVPF